MDKVRIGIRRLRQSAVIGFIARAEIEGSVLKPESNGPQPNSKKGQQRKYPKR